MINIFVAGGFAPAGDDLLGCPEINLDEKYNFDADQCTIMKPMIKRRSEFRLHSIEEDLFAVGGDGREQRTIEKYDSANNPWEIIDLASKIKIRESVTVRMRN